MMFGGLGVGLAVAAACLGVQALAGAVGARYFVNSGYRHSTFPRTLNFLRFVGLMLVLMVGNVIQVLAWALLYQSLDAFPDLSTALYFSGVTFTSLGYGDFVLTGDIRMLAPIQAANGLMMFGIATALFIAAVQAAGRQDRNETEQKAD
jgi:hypothetical protein